MAAAAAAAAAASGSVAVSVAPRRALHWVFRVGDLQESVRFYEKVLGFGVLRHEEFEKECDASCNGPYAGSWSKTMIGPGHEHTNFVLELTYNYGIPKYTLGNDLRCIAVRDTPTGIAAAAAKHGFAVTAGGADGKQQLVTAPDGYQYLILPAAAKAGGAGAGAGAGASAEDGIKQQIVYVSLHTADLKQAKAYWHGVLGLKVLRETADTLLVAYAPEQTALEFVQLPKGVALEHAEAFGRVAFDIADSVTPVEAAVKASGDAIQVGPLTLDTPGKATVTVIITRDRDGTEICHVERTGFAALSDPKPGDEKIDWQQRKTKVEAQTKWRAKQERMKAAAAAAAAPAAASAAAPAPAAAATK